MKATGIVRKIDELVIPIELRRTLNIGEKDALVHYNGIVAVDMY